VYSHAFVASIALNALDIIPQIVLQNNFNSVLPEKTIPAADTHDA